MPWQKVMSKFKRGKLHTGSKKGPKVKSRKQAIAIMMAEKRSGKKEYHSSGARKNTKKCPTCGGRH